MTGIPLSSSFKELNQSWKEIKSLIVAQIIPSKRWSEMNSLMTEDTIRPKYRLDFDSGRSIRLNQDCFIFLSACFEPAFYDEVEITS